MNKKYFWLLGILMVLVFISIPVFHILRTKWNETIDKIEIPSGYTNDASQLNLTKIDTTIQVPNDKIQIQNQLRFIIEDAKENNIKISIAGAQHSMGGHTIYPDGIILNMLN